MGRDNVRRGFTLIELLIVIAIIIVLAAILFPVFASAKQSALRTRCIENEKQILHGVCLYMQDSGGRVPPGYSTDGAKYNWGQGMFGATWADRIAKYVRSNAVFVCPVIPEQLLSQGAGYFTPGSGGWITTYGMNWRLCSGGGDQNYPAKIGPHSPVATIMGAGMWGVTVSASSMVAPSKTVMICESEAMASNVTKNSTAGGGGVLVFDDDGAGNANWPYYWLIRWLDTPYSPQGHSGGAVFGMVDGHVQWVKCVPPTPSTTNIGTPPRDSDGKPLSSVKKAGLRWW